LLDKAEQINRLSEEDAARLAPIRASLNKALERVEKRGQLLKYIPTFCSTYGLNFEGSTKSHILDLVWAFQILDKPQVADDGVKEPTFYKLLYYIERAAREGEDEQLSKRWTPARFDYFWDQLVSAICNDSHH
jgi:hypothetical protein